MKEFIMSCVGALIVSFLGWLTKSVYQYFRYYRNSKYSGEWRDEIYNERNQIIKKDIIVLRHNKRTNCVTGSVKRIYPNEQTHRKWQCSGVITANHLIVSFWSDDLIMSDGCVYAVMINDYIYEGYYLKEINNEIHNIKIRLTKETKL